MTMQYKSNSFPAVLKFYSGIRKPDYVPGFFRGILFVEGVDKSTGPGYSFCIDREVTSRDAKLPYDEEIQTAVKFLIGKLPEEWAVGTRFQICEGSTMIGEGWLT